MTSDAHAKLSAVEKQALRLVSEQGAVPADQMAAFLAVDQVECLRLMSRLEAAGYAEQGRLLVGEPVWFWLRGRGAREAATGLPALWPKVGAMKRMRAVNAVRLYLEEREPDGRWICGRRMRRELGVCGCRPSGVFKVGGEQHAVDVRQGRPRSSGQEWARALTLMEGFDAVVYFVDPVFRRCLEREAGGQPWPKLFLRDLPRGAVGMAGPL